MLVAVSAMTVLTMSLVLFQVMIMFVPIMVMTMLTVVMVVMIVMVVNVSMMLLHFNPPGANIELLGKVQFERMMLNSLNSHIKSEAAQKAALRYSVC